MGKYLKANIRLDKIRQRNLKPHYKHLNPLEYRFVKAFEAVNQYEKDISRMERFENDWRNTEGGQLLLERYLKAVGKKIKLSNKLGLETEKQEYELYNSCHKSRFYGGSY